MHLLTPLLPIVLAWMCQCVGLLGDAGGSVSNDLCSLGWINHLQFCVSPCSLYFSPGLPVPLLDPAYQ